MTIHGVADSENQVRLDSAAGSPMPPKGKENATAGKKKAAKVPPVPPRPRRVTLVVSYATRGPGYTFGFGAHYRALRAAMYQNFKQDTLDIVGNGMQSAAGLDPFEVKCMEDAPLLGEVVPAHVSLLIPCHV